MALSYGTEKLQYICEECEKCEEREKREEFKECNASHLYEIDTFHEKPSDIKKQFLKFEGYLEALLKSMTTVQKSMSLQ